MGMPAARVLAAAGIWLMMLGLIVLTGVVVIFECGSLRKAELIKHQWSLARKYQDAHTQRMRQKQQHVDGSDTTAWPRFSYACMSILPRFAG
jgi:hypothetical protein